MTWICGGVLLIVWSWVTAAVPVWLSVGVKRRRAVTDPAVPTWSATAFHTKLCAVPPGAEVTSTS